jgi:hypothetical protein
MLPVSQVRGEGVSIILRYAILYVAWPVFHTHKIIKYIFNTVNVEYLFVSNVFRVHIAVWSCAKIADP